MRQLQVVNANYTNTATPKLTSWSSTRKPSTRKPTAWPTRKPSSKPTFWPTRKPASKPTSKTITSKPTQTKVPTSKPSIFCFPDRAALKSAVDSYISQNCATTNPTCATRTHYGEIGTWCVKLVTSMAYVFAGKSSFNSDLSNWNVGSVTDMYGMFAETLSFNSDLSNWNVGSVTEMGNMFRGATNFNQNLCPWGSKLPNSFNYRANADFMFDSTICPNVNQPTNATGPWCANCPA